jgi:hypothetical protein
LFCCFFVRQAGLRHMAQPPVCWDYKHEPLHITENDF